MEYTGKLYAKIGGKYLEISHTDSFDALEEKLKRLQTNIIAYQNEIQQKNDTIKDIAHRISKITNILNE